VVREQLTFLAANYRYMKLSIISFLFLLTLHVFAAPPPPASVSGSLVFSNVVNVKWTQFGAKGDGITDDTAAIQAAVNAAASPLRGAVHLPASTYKTSGQINVPSNVRVFGDGPLSIIDNVSTNDYILVSDGGSTNVVIENLAVKGHGVFDNSTAGRAAIKLTHFGSSRGNCAVLRNLWIYDSGVTGLGIDQWDDVFAENIFIFNAAEHGVYVTLNNSVQLNNICVVSNRFGNGVKMVGNTFVTVHHSAFMGTENAGGLFDTANVRCAFESCQFSTNVQQGVRINSGNINCAIRNCDIYRALQDEIRCTGGTNTIISGNRIWSVDRAIVCDAGAPGSVILGNFIQSGGDPAILVNSKSVIGVNTVIGVGTAIQIGSTSTNTVLFANTLLTGTDLSDSGVGTILSSQTSGTNTLFTGNVDLRSGAYYGNGLGLSNVTVNMTWTNSTNFTAYASGTAYTITGSSAALDFGTTDPVLTINQAGTYLIQSNVGVKYSGATYAAPQTVTFKLRRTNNTAADLTNGSRAVELPVLTTFTGGDVMTLPPVIYTATSGDAITIFGILSATPAAGSVLADSAELVAIKLY